MCKYSIHVISHEIMLSASQFPSTQCSGDSFWKKAYEEKRKLGNHVIRQSRRQSGVFIYSSTDVCHCHALNGADCFMTSQSGLAWKHLHSIPRANMPGWKSDKDPGPSIVRQRCARMSLEGVSAKSPLRRRQECACSMNDGQDPRFLDNKE